MRKAHCMIWNMLKKKTPRNLENEKCSLQDMDNGKKNQKNVENKAQILYELESCEKN